VHKKEWVGWLAGGCDCASAVCTMMIELSCLVGKGAWIGVHAANVMREEDWRAIGVFSCVTCLFLLAFFLAIDRKNVKRRREPSVRDLQRVLGLHAPGCGEPEVACIVCV